MLFFLYEETSSLVFMRDFTVTTWLFVVVRPGKQTLYISGMLNNPLLTLKNTPNTVHKIDFLTICSSTSQTR